MFHPQGPTFIELARQALSATEHGYDLLAPKFDLTPFRTSDRLLAAVRPTVERLGPFRSGLDVCCGTGAGMHVLAPMCSSKLVGIDFSQGMLEIAKTGLASRPFTNAQLQVEFHKGDVLDMQLEGLFDVAVCFGAFGHILPKDEARFVDRVWQALRTGGHFIFVTTTMPRATSRAYWMSVAFNLVMRLRNFMLRPPFVMYYLTFLWPDVKPLLEKAGFSVTAEPTFPNVNGPGSFLTVVATKR